ncbi:MAG TPA: GTPase HflX [Terriglobia bacterium]|nr:GTPase HflX [Terriglobia bacterium]
MRSNISEPRHLERAYLADWTPSRGPGAAIKPASRASAVPDEDAMRELAELAASAGAEVAGFTGQRSPAPDPATLVGRGKVEEIRASAERLRATCVIFGHDLSPTQLRNLEAALGVKVIDRTQLILDIFARRARTREGKLQVELAQLNYLLPRLAGQGTRLSRLGGGIGTRGPGEQKLEFDRRRIRARISKLEGALDKVRAQRSLHRRHRREQNFLSVALVGYTNAGKSTLFNALTQAKILESPRLFATLDPTVRALSLESHPKTLLSDTVGFIRNLPAHLVVAFRATLEELDSADLLLHVVDASHPEWAEHCEAVDKTLESMGLAAAPRLRVWNKVDLLVEAARRRIPPDDVAVSARTGEGIAALLERIDHLLPGEPVIEAEFNFSAADGESLARLHRMGAVLSTRFVGRRVLVRARVPESLRIRGQTRGSPLDRGISS